MSSENRENTDRLDREPVGEAEGKKAPAETKRPTEKSEKSAASAPKSGKKKTAAKGVSDGKKKPKKTAEELAAEQAAREEAEREKRKKARRVLRGWLIALIVIVSLALILCVGATVGAYLVTNSETNLPNVYLDGVYVGGMTTEETVRALDESGWDEKKGGTLTVTLPEGVSFELDRLTAGAYQPKEEAAEIAFRYGHTDDWFGNLYTYVTDLFEAKDLSRTEFTIDRGYVAAAVNKAVDEFEAVTAGEAYSINEEKSTLEAVKGAGEITLDREAICDKACALLLAGESELEWTAIVGEPTMPDFRAVAAELDREPENAWYDPEEDKIYPETKGLKVNVEEAERLWKEAAVMEKISVPITILEPEITEQTLSESLFRDKLGECTTYLWGSTLNRISNVRLACSRFDGMVLSPGDVFSYNDVVGERTAEAGFKLAPVYSGTAHLEGLGGGICQVSSTLYNAVLLANLEINERVCHTMAVGYLPLGLDATVDWPSTNFVFTNNRDYPIKIKAAVDDSGRMVTIEIWGTNVDGSHVEMLHFEWPTYDDYYQEQYGLDVHVGYGARSVRRIYDADGNYTDEESVYSYYHLPDEEIRWPAIPKEEEPEEESEPAAEDTGTVTEDTGTVVEDTEVVVDDTEVVVDG